MCQQIVSAHVTISQLMSESLQQRRGRNPATGTSGTKINTPSTILEQKVVLVIDSFGTKNSAMNIPICSSVTKYSALIATLIETPLST